MEWCFTFQWRVVFQIGWASFLSGGCALLRGIGFDGGFSKKIIGWRGAPMPPLTMGNPENWSLNSCCEVSFS